MTTPPTVVVHQSPELLVEAVAARLITRLVDAQAAAGHAHLVLTGGGTGIKTLAALAASPALDAIDTKAIDIWWGDERFLPSGDPERNATQAQAALLDSWPVPEHRIHRMAASDGPDGDDVDAAAARYAAELLAAALPQDHAVVPSFDVLLLGVGPDGHVASLFPEHPGLYVEGTGAIPVRNSPKPPPTRISLTVEAIQAAREVWLVAAGADKAGAFGLAASGAGRLAIPAVGAVGRQRTLWLLDEAAAAQLPASIRRIASP